MSSADTPALSDLREVHRRHIFFLREQLQQVSAERSALRDELFSMRTAELRRAMKEDFRRHLHRMIVIWALTLMSTIGLYFRR